MIIPSYSHDEVKMINDLSTNWNKRDSRIVIARGIKDSFELYLGGIDYAARAMLLYQPLTAKFIKSGRSEDFWTYSADTLYDSSLLLAHNLFDDDKNINFKNLVALQKQLQQRNNSTKEIKWDLNPSLDIADVIGRIKNQRNKRIAHHERKGLKPVQWDDPVVAFEYARNYLQTFYLRFLGADFEINSLYERAEELYCSTLSAVGIDSQAEQDAVLAELKNYLTKVGSKNVSA